MPHSVELPDEIFERLKSIAEPFVDTPATVIAKLLDLYELDNKEIKEGIHLESDIRVLDPLNPGSLSFTKVLEAKFDNKPASKWFDLAKVAHIVAYEYVDGSFDRLRSLSKMNISRGELTDKGFDYLDEIDISIQRADASVTWRNVLHIAQQLSLPITVRLVWRDRVGAAYPNVEGELSWKPNTQNLFDE